MDTIRIGIIGIGAIAREHIGILQSGFPEVEIAALADPDGSAAESAVQKLFKDADNVPVCYGNHLDMFENEVLSGVVICSPHKLHFGQIMDALENKCHVLVEKPMVTKTRHAQKIAQTVEAGEQIVSVVYPGYFSGGFEFARKIVSDAAIGEMRMITGVTAENWLNKVDEKWRMDPEFCGGGYLYESGDNIINAMLHITGKDVRKVHAFTNNLETKLDVLSSVSMVFEDGAIGTVSANGDSLTVRQELQIQGTKGALKMDISGNEIRFWKKNTEQELEIQRPTGNVHKNFIECMSNKANPVCGARQALKYTRIMDSIYTSAREQQSVEIDGG